MGAGIRTDERLRPRRRGAPALIGRGNSRPGRFPPSAPCPRSVKFDRAIETLAANSPDRPQERISLSPSLFLLASQVTAAGGKSREPRCSVKLASPSVEMTGPDLPHSLLA